MTEAEKKKNRQIAAKLTRPKPQELPSGAWRCEIMVDGKRMSVVDDDPKIAHAKAVAMRSGIIKKEKSPFSMTVGEAIDNYIQSKDTVLSPSTISGYKRVRKQYLQDIMDVRIGILTQEDIQRSVNALAKTKSPKTVRNAHGLLTAALDMYAPGFKVRTTLPQKKRYDAAVPTKKDIEAIMRQAKGGRDEIPILLAIWLGLRMSEILGLKWSDIDGNVLHIRRARVDEGVKTTKTYSSQRNLMIPDEIKTLLDKAPRLSEYVVNSERKALYSRFQTICKYAGVSQHYRFHDLRHINASVMLALGVPNKYAQERMGHSTDNMLKTVYQHTMSAESIRYGSMVDKYFSEIYAQLTHDKDGDA